MIGSQYTARVPTTWWLLPLLALLAYAAWPYVEVYRFERAVVTNDVEVLGQLVDLESVREQIKNRLNKEMDSQVGEVSNEFVDWIQDGLLRLGSHAIDSLVSLDWVSEQLLAKSVEGHGFRQRIGYAFFDSPTGFLLRVGEVENDPVHVHLSLQGLHWRVTAVYN